MIKALFFDIDGTLVSFRTHSVPKPTVEALAEARRRGVRIFISTGRPKPLINNLDPIESLIDGYITVNGAICTVGSETVSRNPIDPKDVEVILHAADRMDVPSLIVGEDRAIVHNHKPIVDRIFDIPDDSFLRHRSGSGGGQAAQALRVHPLVRVLL